MRLSLLAVTTAFVLLGSCDPSPTGGPICTRASTEVCMVGNRFDPTPLTVPPGATVVWRNADGVRHRVQSAAIGSIESFDSGDIPSGGAFPLPVNTLGTVRYYCRYHGQDGTPPLGMSGTITVKQ